MGPEAPPTNFDYFFIISGCLIYVLLALGETIGFIILFYNLFGSTLLKLGETMGLIFIF